MNRGGFSWKRLSGYSGAKSRLSRQIGVPLTKSGRQRKVGRMVTGGGYAIPLLIIGLALIGLACGNTGALTPTAPLAPSPVSTTGSTSAGLGNDRRAWDRQHTSNGANAGFQDYDTGAYSLIFTDEKIWQLERNYKAPVPLSRARSDAAALIPTDATLVRTYHPEGFPELTVDLYLSPWLRDRFPAEDWTGGEPGNFIIIFNIHDGQIHRSVIGLGNNPVGGVVPPAASNTATTPSPIAATPVIKAPTVNTAANLRAGPGTTYAKVGGVPAGQALNIIARNQAGDWYQLASGAWIAASLVANPPAAVTVATVIPATQAAAAQVTVVAAPVRAAAVPTARGIPAAAASDCDCDHGNTLNCDDFESWDAQACYLRCKELKGEDVHGLDRDSDGNACEWEY